MARLSALLALTAAAVAVSANPIVVRDSPITLSIARRFNTTGVVNVLEADLARAKVLKSRGQAAHAAVPHTARSAVNVAITNTAVVYSASVGVGSPATTYDLLIDTGSSNTWVGAGKSYVKTKTSVDTGNTVVSLSRPTRASP
uniref:Cytochrome P450 33C9 n=1 Tax=Ganoderma boninense TaxID=34458 RepID=A0A5K1K8F2_9APHY|nr:Cytochrome P450 33C9 [Ganoderma boninense]